MRALIAGKHIFDIIERVPEVRSPDEEKDVITKIEIGDGIKFENVSFRYPT